MSAPTLTAVKDRIVALCATIPDITTVLEGYPEGDVPFEDHELPVIVVQYGPAQNTRASGDSYTSVRQWRLILHVAHTEGDIVDVNLADVEAVEPYLSSIPLFFLQRPRLELNNSGLVTQITVPSDSGNYRIQRGGALWRGAVFTFSITTNHYQQGV